jgi:tRNA threonylcarbamoyladenosine biosynthesis protein TsaB
MKLFIDTSIAEKIVIGLGEQRFEADAKKERSQKLLPFIDEKLKELNKSIDDISEIEVVTGPGSFTGLRVGVSVANTIGWAQQIQVNGQDIKKSGPITPNYS